MVKLSEQLKESENNERITRTQRVAEKQAIERQRLKQDRINEAKKRLSEATYENYEDVYNSINPEYRVGVLSPDEIKQTEGYKTYIEEKRKQQEIAKWRPYFLAYDRSRRGKPFVLGLNPTKEEVRRYNEVIKAVKGQPSSVPQYVVATLRGGMTTDFAKSPSVYGLDVGETRIIETKDKETGEVKRIEKYYRDPKTEKLMYSIETDPQPKGSYVDQTGKGISITEKELLKGVEEGKIKAGGTYRSLSGEYYELTSTEANSDFIDQRTGKPYGYVDIAPTNKEIYQREISEKGYVKGTLSYLAGKFESKVLQGQFKRAMKNEDYELYQPYATGRLARFSVETAPYFTPVGVPLLLASGGEDLLTKSGRERIKLEEKYYFDEKGYNKIVSKALSYGKPALEVGIGLLGLRSYYKNVRAIREQKAFEKTPAVVVGTRLEGTKGGIDVIYGLKKVGKVRYVTKIKQPYYLTDTGFTLEKGSAISYRSSKPFAKDLQVSYSEIAGRGKISQKLSSYVSEKLETPYLYKDPIIISRELEGFQGGYGKILTTERARGLLKIKKGVEFPTGKTRVNLILDMQKLKNLETTRKYFGGIGKEEDGIIKVIGGEAKTLSVNYDRVLNKLLSKKLKVNIENVGLIKKIKLKDLNVRKQFEIEDLPEINKLVLKKFKGKTNNVNQISQQIEKQSVNQATGYQQEAVEGVLSKLVPQTEKIKVFPVLKQKQSTLNIIKQDEKLNSQLRQEINLKSLEKQKTVSIQEQKSEQKLKTQIKQLLGISPKEQLKYRLSTGQIQKQIQKQQQRSVQIPSFSVPRILRVPKPKEPIIPPIIPILKPKIQKIIKKKKKRSDFELAYLPDFTSRAIGLDPDVVSGKQAQARIKKILTGLEIRKGVIVK